MIKCQKGAAGVEPADLSICSRMLCHWAIPPLPVMAGSHTWVSTFDTARSCWPYTHCIQCFMYVTDHVGQCGPWTGGGGSGAPSTVMYRETRCPGASLLVFPLFYIANWEGSSRCWRNFTIQFTCACLLAADRIVVSTSRCGHRQPGIESWSRAEPSCVRLCHGMQVMDFFSNFILYYYWKRFTRLFSKVGGCFVFFFSF